MLKDELKSLNLQHDARLEEIDKDTAALETVKSHVNGFQEASIVLKTDTQRLQSAIRPLESEKVHLEQCVSDLVDKKRDLETSVNALDSEFAACELRIIQAEAKYTVLITKKEAVVKNLDTKTLDMLHKIKESEVAESATREDLSRWQRVLEERDRNLRIRENKVEMGEDKLVQNSNLLNL